MITEEALAGKLATATTTKSGLTVEAVLDTHEYPTGIKVTKAQVEDVPLTRQAFHGEWNYTIHCGPLPESLPDKTFITKSIK